MKRKNLPAWQQVVLTALANVPEDGTGHDAWDRLNKEEQSAVMDFLTGHCGEDAQARLEETCGLVKSRRGWQAVIAMIVTFALIVGFAAGTSWLGEWLDMDLLPYLWILVCAENLRRAWDAPPAWKLQDIWCKRVDTHYGTTLALQDMYRWACLPPRERRRRGEVICWTVLLALNILLGGVEWKRAQEPSVPQQVVAVLEDAAEGEASLEDAMLLLAGPEYEYGRSKEVFQAVWEKTAKWSDERYLAAALAVRLGLESAPDYAREALLTTRLGAIDTPGEASEFAALLALCDADTAQAVRARVEAATFPEKATVMAAFE